MLQKGNAFRGRPTGPNQPTMRKPSAAGLTEFEFFLIWAWEARAVPERSAVECKR